MINRIVNFSVKKMSGEVTQATLHTLWKVNRFAPFVNGEILTNSYCPPTML